MCELLDEKFYYVSSINTKIQSSSQNFQFLNQKNFLEEFNFSSKNVRFLKNYQGKYQAVWIVRLVQNNIDFLISANFSQSHFYFQAKTLQNMCPVSVKTKEYRKMLIKQFSKKSYLSIMTFYQAIFSMQNGQWCIKSPIYYNELRNKQFNNQIHQAATFLIKSLNMNLQLISKISRQKVQQLSENKQGKSYQILRYYSRCTTAPSISIKSDCAEYQSVINRYAASKCDLQDLSKYNNQAIKITKLYFGSLWIYGIDISSDNKQHYLQEISLREKQKIQEQINIPSYTLLKSKENKYIFNHCYFLNTTYQERKVNIGGNSQIFVLKPQIYEYSSTSNQTQNKIVKSQNISKYIIKHLVYKKSRQNSNSQKTQQNEKELKRQYLDKETVIVSYLRVGSCLFLPKYYLNVENNSPYGNRLFIEYLPGQTLDEYVLNNAETISLFTKIYLILQILQALRFVASYGIVHLDLKESNIIVIKKMICKLIDFDQSYHYKVYDLNHKPKYTLIYAPPEVVTSFEGRPFTQKSDVFSLGIMIHNLLFGKHPYFFPNQESFQKSNFKQSLRKKTFIVPQLAQSIYGNTLIINILYQLILKCIDWKQTKRPYLDWITLVFKICFNYLTCQ